MDSGIFILYCGLESNISKVWIRIHYFTYFLLFKSFQVWPWEPLWSSFCDFWSWTFLCQALPYFLAPQVCDSPDTFPSPTLESVTSPWNPSLHFWISMSQSQLYSHHHFLGRTLAPGDRVLAWLVLPFPHYRKECPTHLGSSWCSGWSSRGWLLLSFCWPLIISQRVLVSGTEGIGGCEALPASSSLGSLTLGIKSLSSFF